MMQQCTLGDLRETSVCQQLMLQISMHEILVQLEFKDGKKAEGSGTIVTFGSLRGILTASHVIASYKKLENKIISVPSYVYDDYYEKIQLHFTHVLTIDDLNACTSAIWSEKRLDIALIVLNEENYDQLIKRCNKQTVDLDSFHARYFDNQKLYTSNGKSEWIGVIYGHPREGETIRNGITELSYSGPYLGGPEFITCREKLKVPAKGYNGLVTDLILMGRGKTLDSLPNDFGGTSGGGLWLIALNEQYEIVEKFFAGVFVCAESNANKEDGKLYSRGPVSLYTIFCRYLKENIILD